MAFILFIYKYIDVAKLFPQGLLIQIYIFNEIWNKCFKRMLNPYKVDT